MSLIRKITFSPRITNATTPQEKVEKTRATIVSKVPVLAAPSSKQKLQQHKQLQQQQQHQKQLQQQCQKNQAFTESRSTSKESISMNSPPPIRSLSAPLPMSKAARKAFLAAKQTKAIEKLDKMIDRIQGQGNGEDDMDMEGGCPLFLPPPPPRHMSNSISDSNICSHG